jgi:hypothetical protein
VHNNRRAQYLGLRRLCTRCTPFYTTRSTRYTTVGYAREWIETALEIESGRHKASCAPLPATAMALRRRSVTPSRRHRRTVHRQRDALRQTFVSRRHELSDQLQQRRQRDHAQEVTYSNLLFSQRLLCVSRACLGKRTNFGGQQPAPKEGVSCTAVRLGRLSRRMPGRSLVRTCKQILSWSDFFIFAVPNLSWHLCCPEPVLANDAFFIRTYINEKMGCYVRLVGTTGRG